MIEEPAGNKRSICIAIISPAARLHNLRNCLEITSEQFLRFVLSNYNVKNLLPFIGKHFITLK